MHLLLIEDHASLRNAISQFLREADYVVDTFSTGDEGMMKRPLFDDERAGRALHAHGRWRGLAGVAPVDKLGVVFIMVLATVFLKEKITMPHLGGGLLIVLGAIVPAWENRNP